MPALLRIGEAAAAPGPARRPRAAPREPFQAHQAVFRCSLRILLANSPGQNLCGKICSLHDANPDKNRALVLSISTEIRSISHSFLLAVISPAVSPPFFANAHQNGAMAPQRAC